MALSRYAYLSSHPVFTTAQEFEGKEISIFSLGGRNGNIVVYPTGGEVLRDNVIAALDEAILYYQPLWSSSSTPEFQIVVGFYNRAKRDVIADAQMAASADADFLQGFQAQLGVDLSVCTIRIWSIFAADPHRFATLAHELSHCYQDYYQGSSLNFLYKPDTMAWWVEGSAEWMASLVYPLQYPSKLSGSI